jgi:hypothetical protein
MKEGGKPIDEINKNKVCDEIKGWLIRKLTHEGIH